MPPASPPCSARKGWLPSRLRDLGYNTYLVGKFLNAFSPKRPSDCPEGWTLFDPLTDATVYKYNDFDFQPEVGSCSDTASVPLCVCACACG